ncbi:endonuclease/exonuclease/phosphatase family protein [Paenibacillus caseinilyticus]|uniref:Endonuclease/exonuclease/phosphatase domain-containing protein n=2 Tax=Paenibacillus mucilaginosus K02 TaxID=997761 RepID=I0BL26_9BACL|nr:endonuclease/exonuclease/phosphatase family protein [Paenibacillus mucilaginosus]AFH63073.1 hypothetical protein B2K_20600 [Paenibacillus mucilaginosus K02]
MHTKRVGRAGMLMRWLLLIALAVPVAVLSNQDPASAAGRKAVRILHYNVQGITDLFNGEEYNLTPYDRGLQIGDKILAGDYDVVTLNEVFDSGMKEGITEKLKRHYDYALTEMGDTSTLDGIFGNSGLAVYSKLKPLPRSDLGSIVAKQIPVLKPCPSPDGGCPDEYEMVDVTVPQLICGTYHILDSYGFDSSCSSGFLPYDDLYHDDSYSRKGVGWVRLEDPAGLPLNVFFSHTQATYSIPDADAETGRAGNFAQIADLIRWVLPGQSLTNEAIVLTGDLNVIAGSTEYDTLIGTNSELHQLGLEDTWAVHNSPKGKDPGFTRRLMNTHVLIDEEFKSDQRLDYILAKYPRGCFLHSTVKRDYKDTKGTDLSDHYGVDIAIGTSAAYCSPSTAKVDPPEGANAMNLSAAGNVQWMYFPDPGTYTFKAGAGTPPAAFELTAFAENEMSFPVEPWEGSPALTSREETVEYSPPGPFYLRIRPVKADGSHDKDWTGPYTMQIHQATGATWEDAIALHPTQPMNATMVKDDGIHPLQKEVYFKFRTELSDAQQKPWSTFKLKQKRLLGGQYADPASNSPPKSFGYAIRESKNGPTLYGSGASQVTLPAFEKTFGSTAQTLGTGEYRLIVSRTQPAVNEAAYFAITYETNLRILDIVELYCIEQEDLTGDDDPYLNLLLDNTASSTFYYPDTDSDQGHNDPSCISGTALKPHAIKILSSAEIKLMEEDDADDDDLLDSTTINAGPNDNGTLQQDKLQGDGADYRLKYTVNQLY